jgi:uncharacterized membrane protein HdeD (DUF308 family)
MDAQTKALAKPLEDLYAKVPALPANVREVLVKIAPWLSLIFGVLTVLTGVAALGLFTALSPFTSTYGGLGYGAFTMVYAAVVVVEGVVMVLAFSPLKARKVRGWNLLFWSEILAVVSSVVTLSVGSVVGALIGAVIAFYILFQMRSYYK